MQAQDLGIYSVLYFNIFLIHYFTLYFVYVLFLLIEVTKFRCINPYFNIKEITSLFIYLIVFHFLGLIFY